MTESPRESAPQGESTAIERCACGEHVMERWCGTYCDHLGTHRPEACTLSLALDLRDERGRVKELEERLDSPNLHFSCNQTMNIGDAVRRAEAAEARAASLADQLAAAVEALREDVADGENVPGLTEWLRERKGLLGNLSQESATWRSRVRAEGAAEERERCAQVVEAMAHDDFGCVGKNHAARLIRERASAPTQESPE